MTNPNNAVGTNGAFGGRTSVNAFNDVMAAFQGRGILSGWAISPDSGMTVAIGGSGITRDSAIAEDNAGNKTSVNNISQAPIPLAIGAAPVANSRIDAIVAYVDNPPSGTDTIIDNYGACGLLDVQGAVSGIPTAPDDAAIRLAITTDGASGSTAYYVVLGYVMVANGTTDITAEMVTAGNYATIGTNQIGDDAINTNKIADGAITTDKIEDGSVTSQKVDWATLKLWSTAEQIAGSMDDGTIVYCKTQTVTTPSSPSGGRPLDTTGIGVVLDSEVRILGANGFLLKGPTYAEGGNLNFSVTVSSDTAYFSNLVGGFQGKTAYVTRWYTRG